jgi:hyperosmotically inducible periplasmic protein
MKRFPQLVVFFFALALMFGQPLASIAAQSTKAVIDDSAITTSVKEKLAKDVRLGTLTGIEVNTTKGVVTLAGKVKSKSEKSAVEKLAKSVKGVKKVKSELQIVK